MTGNDIHDLVQRMPEVRLSETDRAEVWREIAHELSREQGPPRNIRRLRSLRHSAAWASAAVVIVGGGFLVQHRNHGFTAQPTEQTRITGIQTDAPEMFTYPEWRVVVSPSVNMSAAHYDIAIYYTGSTPAVIESVENRSTASQFFSPKYNLTPGTAASGQPHLYLPAGLQTYAGVIHWHEQGVEKTQSFALTGVATPLDVLRESAYHGQSDHWHAQLTERVIGNDSFHTGINMVLDMQYQGPPLSDTSARVRVNQGTGYSQSDERIQNGVMEESLEVYVQDYTKNPVQSVQISWQGQTETIQLSP